MQTKYDEPDDGESEKPLETAPYEALTFTLSTPPAGFTIGATADITVQIDGLATDKALPEVTYVWSSSDSDEAIIRLVADNATATIEAVGAGSTTVTVTCEEYPSLTASAEITVIDGENPYPSMTLTLSGVPSSFYAGSSATMTATVGNYPASVTAPVTLTWRSEDEGIFIVTDAQTSYAGVPMTATINAVSPGTSTLTVTCNEYPSLSASVDIRVTPAEEARYNKIFVDFGLETRTSVSPWNNIVKFENYKLKDELGLDSGVSIDLSSWTASNKYEEYYTTGFSTAGDIEFNGIVFTSAQYQDWLFSNNVAEASFTINGLDPTLTYEMTTVSIRWNSAANIREMSLELKGEGEVQNSGTIHQGIKCKDALKEGEEAQEPYCFEDDWSAIDWSDYCKIFTLQPDASGTITVTLKAKSVETTSTNQQAHLNALVITPIKPEEE